MWTNRLFQSIVLLSFFGLVNAACAEPMLLVEIRQHGFVQRGFVGQPIGLSFVTEITDHTTQTVLGGTYDNSDVGTVLEASTQQLAGIEAAFHAPGGRFWFDTSSHAPAPTGVGAIWEPSPIGWEINLHVPRLGRGLTGYDLTSVTQTIDRLRYVPDLVGDIFADFAHTISLYGEAIPEMSSFWMCAYLATLLSMCCRCWRS